MTNDLLDPGPSRPTRFWTTSKPLLSGRFYPTEGRSLALVSDDNFNRSKTTRVIVLAVARDLL
jgi:hypothetical protein